MQQLRLAVGETGELDNTFDNMNWATLTQSFTERESFTSNIEPAFCGFR